jgi:hypothetical protein
MPDASLPDYHSRLIVKVIVLSREKFEFLPTLRSYRNAVTAHLATTSLASTETA